MSDRNMPKYFVVVGEVAGFDSLSELNEWLNNVDAVPSEDGLSFTRGIDGEDTLTVIKGHIKQLKVKTVVGLG